eukprot:868043-Pyramimonas_sp.AAC.1
MDDLEVALMESTKTAEVEREKRARDEEKMSQEEEQALAESKDLFKRKRGYSPSPAREPCPRG